jgi:hypothetical protein
LNPPGPARSRAFSCPHPGKKIPPELRMAIR